MTVPSWEFEKYDPDTGNVAGRIADLVKNTTLAAPGVLGDGEIGLDLPSPEASLLAREGIQNVWDNARERAQKEGTAPDCQLEFRFLELQGTEKATFVKAAALHELADRSHQVEAEVTGFADPTTYQRLDDPDHPLRLMQLVEITGTTGMYGQWKGRQSRLNLAMLNVGFNKKAHGLGGAFGFGKAALIRCSGLRMVAAYTAFNPDVFLEEEGQDDTTDRRFIAVNYWGGHQIGPDEFTGWARLGNGPRPVEGDVADDWARAFAVDVRDPRLTTGGQGIGSTLVVLDPIIDPNDLRLAVERYWWPALTKDDWNLKVEITDYDGETLRPSPKTNPDLAPFVQAYDWLQSNPKDTKRNKYFSKINLPGSGKQVTPGAVSLVHEEAEGSWTWPLEEDGVSHCSLVALCRDPRMVVTYLECGNKKPFLRGIFVTPEVDGPNDLLTETEAGLHLDWPSDGRDPGVNPDAYWAAGEIKRLIKQQVGAARRGLFRPTRGPSKATLPELARFMRDFFGDGPGQKKVIDNLPEHRTVSIQFDKPAEPDIRDGGIYSAATLSFAPMADFAKDAPFQVRIEISYRIEEEGSTTQQSILGCKVLKVPKGFTSSRSDDGTVVLEGLLPKGETKVDVESNTHDEEWTGAWVPVATRTDQKDDRATQDEESSVG
jgi:hypothetical protein